MKVAVAALTAVVALSAGVVQARPYHHHRHQVCTIHHHHRICHWR